MGGADKGLAPWHDTSLAAHALGRLAAQVATLSLSANRNGAVYATLGVPVFADACEGFAGPLAGVLAGLRHAALPFLAVVPCDAPAFPLDLVARLSSAFDDAAIDVAVAATGDGLQPTFCLVRSRAAASLERYLERGERQARRWIDSERHAIVGFDDRAAFANVNTLAELRALEAHA